MDISVNTKIFFLTPEELVVHELFLVFGPIVSKLGNLKIEASNRVCSEQQRSALTSCKTKVLLEEVNCHLTSSNRIGVTLFSGCLIALEARNRRLTVRPASVELQGLRPLYSTFWFTLPQVGTVEPPTLY